MVLPASTASPAATRRVNAPESSAVVGIALLIASDQASKSSRAGTGYSSAARILAKRIQASAHSNSRMSLGPTALRSAARTAHGSVANRENRVGGSNRLQRVRRVNVTT